MDKYEGQEGAAGMKYDNGKFLAYLPYQDFALAIKAVAEIGSYGAKKYKRSSWKDVPDKEIRYEDALHRHLLARAAGENLDSESGLKHLAHAAWGILAILELELEKEKANAV